MDDFYDMSCKEMDHVIEHARNLSKIGDVKYHTIITMDGHCLQTVNMPEGVSFQRWLRWHPT